MSTCGSCTLCCKVMGVAELAKPRDQWCGHCDKGRGCRIYADRPASCAEFECLWLQTQKLPGTMAMGPELKPDRCHVVLTATAQDNFQANVDPGYPGAWREGAIGTLIRSLVASKHIVIIGCGQRRTLLGANGTVVDDFVADRLDQYPPQGAAS